MSRLLQHTVILPEQGPAQRGLFILHGILGTGTNLRPLAQRLVQASPGLSAVLVDLRMHGRSQHLPGPHTLDACARDLSELKAALDVPITGVVGHSFGGKVALAFHARHPELRYVATLDSMPGSRRDRRGAEHTLSVVDMLERLARTYERREAFVAQVCAEGHSRGIADWLAMNLERTGEGFRLRLDLPAIRELLDDYFERDYWHVLENTQAEVDIVVGGKSAVYDDADRAHLTSVCSQDPARIRCHILENAGHWVHTDDFEGTVAALSAGAHPIGTQ